MRSLPAGVAACVHLGPGEFQTLGYHEDLSGGWQLKPGQRIVGSGMDVTRIKLVNTTAVDQKAVYAMGHDLSVGGAANLVDFTSIESLTVDCNLSGQSGSQVAAGAVRMMGNHARVSSVKVVNWGNKCCRFGIPKQRSKAQWLRGTSYLGKTSPNKYQTLKGFRLWEVGIENGCKMGS